MVNILGFLKYYHQSFITKKSDKLFHNMADFFPEPMIVNINGIISYANQAALKLFGAERAEQLVGKKIDQVIDPAYRESVYQRMNVLMDDKTVAPFQEEKLISLDGQTLIAVVAAVPIIYKGQEAMQVVIRDISLEKKIEEQLTESNKRYHRLLDLSPEPMLVDIGGKIVYVNMSAVKLFGADKPEDLMGKSVLGLAHPDYRQIMANRIKTMQVDCQSLPITEEVLLKFDGSPIFTETVTIPITYQGQPAVQVVINDVTRRKKAEEEVRHQAYHDPLTDLPNRMLFRDRLTMALAQCHRNNNKLAVLFLDLDDFKAVNDTLGHAMGDKLLLGVADRISSCLREMDTVARQGGDEFTILLPEINHVEDAAKVAQKINVVLRQPWFISDQEYYTTTSIGVAIYPNDGQDPETIMKHADIAMYRAKEQKDSYQLYTSAMNVAAFERIALENDLRRAVEREQMVLYYQPQYNAQNGQVIGVEALVRWQHPKRGMVMPTQFIPLAEETRLILPIGEWVLRTACAQNKAWQNAGYPPLRMSVNISAYQFLQKNLVSLVETVLSETGLDPCWLQLEVTESIAMQDIDFTINTLQELRDMGITIAIDDFGTGYSSLNYLRKFPIHTLKIDRSFIRDISIDRGNAAIVTSIIFLAHTLQFNVIAEGVETEEQLNFLKQMKCGEIQGFYFSKPLPANELEVMLRSTIEELA